MPHLDARAIEIDPDGMDRLRRVIASAAGGALAYDPDAYLYDHRPRTPVVSASRLARNWMLYPRKAAKVDPATLIWA